MDLNSNIYYSNNKHDEIIVKITINPLNGISRKKLLELKFEYSHFKSMIKSQITTFLGHAGLTDFFHEIFSINGNLVRTFILLRTSIRHVNFTKILTKFLIVKLE